MKGSIKPLKYFFPILSLLVPFSLSKATEKVSAGNCNWPLFPDPWTYKLKIKCASKIGFCNMYLLKSERMKQSCCILTVGTTGLVEPNFNVSSLVSSFRTFLLFLSARTRPESWIIVRPQQLFSHIGRYVTFPIEMNVNDLQRWACRHHWSEG